MSACAEEIHVVVELRSKREAMVVVRGLLLDAIAPSRQEPGCLRYEVFEDVDEPGVFYLVSGWTHARAAASHIDTPHIQDVLGPLLPLTLGDPVIKRVHRHGEP